MKIISWNLNGLLASLNNGVIDALIGRSPDIICFQEIRTQKEPEILPGYFHHWNHGLREGYSGTAMLLRTEYVRIFNGFLSDFPDDEGRIITLELEDFFVVNAYVPNSQQNLKRQAYRLAWDAAFQEHIQQLLEDKPVIICGDFNVTRSELDFFQENMRQYWASQGYASDERSNFETLLEMGLCDVFRELHPEERSYTWWSNRLNKRQDNRGWRLDYFLVSEELMDCVTDMNHLSDIPGSDHCPIELEVAV